MGRNASLSPSRSQQIAAVKAFHSLGLQAAVSHTALLALVKRARRSQSYIYKAKLFAQQYPSWADVRRKLLRPGVPVPTTSQLQFIVHSSNKDQIRLLKQAHKENWSVMRLHFAVSRRKDPYRTGGRTPRLPASQDDLLFRLNNLAGQWLLWHSRLAESLSDESQQIAFNPSKISKEIQTQMDAVTRSMQRLRQAVDAALTAPTSDSSKAKKSSSRT